MTAQITEAFIKMKDLCKIYLTKW